MKRSDRKKIMKEERPTQNKDNKDANVFRLLVVPKDFVRALNMWEDVINELPKPERIHLLLTTSAEYLGDGFYYVVCNDITSIHLVKKEIKLLTGLLKNKTGKEFSIKPILEADFNFKYEQIHGQSDMKKIHVVEAADGTYCTNLTEILSFSEYMQIISSLSKDFVFIGNMELQMICYLDFAEVHVDLLNNPSKASKINDFTTNKKGKAILRIDKELTRYWKI